MPEEEDVTHEVQELRLEIERLRVELQPFKAIQEDILARKVLDKTKKLLTTGHPLVVSCQISP
ncbi:MAG: hypothetical protein GY797_35635 [Deltaproteobacteria bacterium]|nr:hypothetical protein [Deltaproteobacteria bacterium]